MKELAQTKQRGENMEFGVFDHLDRYGGALADYYEDRLRIVEAYDRAGFYAYHLAEHHSTPLGMAPSPSVFPERGRAAHQQPSVRAAGLGDAAAPSAAADRGNLHARPVERRPAGDRLWRGSVPIELEYYGANPDDAQEVYAEAVELVMRGLTHKVLNFKGKRFSFHDVPMEIEPLQKPHPPIWYGVHMPDSAERAARRNLNVVSLDPPKETRLSIDRYR
jgi:alkanesulfonate monooxygenase SsuD/methylene tetrahydromethanopterin reductase-like flavin-dependent oxidoreductase (luciferase family)